jgi:hypothetical protein
MTQSISLSDQASALIENERRRDRFIRRVSIIAWSVTFGLVLLVAVLVGVQVTEFTKGARSGQVPWAVVIGSAMPLVDVLWKLSLLVAGLSTVGIFLRLRTASLTEIQLRLAALEAMIASKPDSPQA